METWVIREGEIEPGEIKRPLSFQVHVVSLNEKRLMGTLYPVLLIADGIPFSRWQMVQ